ncbi:hypothetical protein [Desulfogranum mediterraneum]|uniref:hypothetical protein n=1 Tax=Desulfogranum mediterraneum TaxID=160661 RepID=UPI0012946A6E|nr:hypothetical protein [Desulfogranum mediterraneum]
MRCEKKIEKAERGEYRINGSVCRRWRKYQEKTQARIPYDVNIVYSNQQNDVQKSGQLDSSAVCDMETIAHFVVN